LGTMSLAKLLPPAIGMKQKNNTVNIAVHELARNFGKNSAKLFRALQQGRLQFDGDVDKRLRGAAEHFVFAIDESKFAADMGVGDGDFTEHAGLHIFHDVRLRDEADADIGGDEALHQFDRIEFHGDVDFKLAFVEYGF